MGGKACGAGAIGAAVGELSAQLYNSGNGDAPAKQDTVAFASMMGGIAAALTGQNAQGVAIASGTAANAAQNNYLAHTDAQRLQQLEWDRARGQCEQEIQALKAKDVSSDQALAACQGVQSAHCGEVRQQVRNAAAGYARSNDACVGGNCGPVFANSPTGFGTLNYQSGKTQQLALDTMSGTTWGRMAGFKDAVGSTIGGTADLVWTGIKTIWDPTARGEISANFDAFGHVISTPSLWKYAAGALTPSQREQLAKDYESGNGYAASKALGEQDAGILMTVAPGPDVPKMAAVLNDASKVGKAVEAGDGAVVGAVSKQVDKGAAVVAKGIPGIDKPFRATNSAHPPSASLVDQMNSMKLCTGTDCSEIAEKLFNAAGGNGKILRVTGKNGGDINLLEHGRVDGPFKYHEVFTDGRYVYDPRLSSSPVPKGDWQQMVRGLNPGAQIK